MKKLLVIRFSALGDVAMTIPVIHSLAMQYPDIQITVLSRKAFQPLFENLPKNVVFMFADLQGEHKGLKGLFRLFRTLKKGNFNGIADLHNVLRTRFLRTLFRLSGTPTAHINKGRQEKRALTRKRNKTCKPLKTSFERYIEVFAKLGFEIQAKFSNIYPTGRGDFEQILPYTGEKGEEKWIGIAPFAKHSGKIYPLELMEQVLSRFVSRGDTKIFLFGGGKTEADILSGWEQKYSGIVSLPGKLDMKKELILMSWLDVMLSMDSANMHMASLVHTPVISIWGATHPRAGFMGWEQSINNAIQIDLPCRPCSVFGDKPCYRKDYTCLNKITPEMIIKQTEKLL